MLIRNAMIYRTETRSFFSGDVLVRDGHISAVTDQATARMLLPQNDIILDAGGRMLLPGFVDIHTHGRAGGDFNTANFATLCRMADSYLRSGVTTVLPTLASAPLGDLCAAIDRINALATEAAQNPTHMPCIAGIHIEGRYLNPSKRGAHAPDLLAPLDPDEACDLLSRIRGVRHITAALEMDGGEAFLARVLETGATVGLGHTAATYAQAVFLLSRGISAMTHLYNAMPPLHHRDGGAVAAGLLDRDVFCELICDGFHIAPEMVKLAYTLKRDHLVLVTDSMEATDCADGDYSIAGMPVIVKDGKARTSDGSIAGSTLSMWQAVRNLASFADIPLGDAVYAATMAPAREVGLDTEIGSIEVGKRADLLLLGEDLSIREIILNGVLCR